MMEENKEVTPTENLEVESTEEVTGITEVDEEVESSDVADEEQVI